ncbi:claudin-7-like isoform X3 [Thunnus albacares]|uniref:claudin-7-like isoform X3 n=1 Tax=Thunnus albacares TaxID=8236 RepID=UPI001CF6FD1C|nr:claudin-7-like isoform X3 [Thunnus albacares]
MSGLQILAFLSGLAGLGATIGATVSHEWRTTSRASSVITATWVLQGLWTNCAGNAIGALHCRPHHTILKLEGLCSLSACSLYAHRITSEFFDPMYIAQKYELGAALFIGWAGSILCILGGSMLCLSIADSFSKSNSQAKYIYKGAASHSHISSYPRGHAKPVNHRPPPDYSNSSRVQHFDKNVYV